MKILFFVALPNPFPGAGWTRVGHFAQTAKKRGHNVKIVGSFLSYRLNKPCIVDWKGIRIYNICPVFGLDSMLTYIVDFVVSMFMLIPILLWRPDVTVISTPPCSPSLGTWLGAKITGSRIVIDYRDAFISYKISTTNSQLDTKALKVYRRFMSILYQKSDLVVTVTTGTQKILRNLGVNSTVIPNGADTETFRPIDRKNRVFTMIFVCGAIDYYDMTSTQQAVSLLDDLDIKIVIVGDFSSIPRIPWINKVKRTAQKFGLEDSLVFTGPITDHNKLAEKISMANIGIIPVEEGHICSETSYPVKLFEYCACGIPSIVIGQDSSLMGKLVNVHRIGIVVPYGDVIGLTKAIRKLYENDGYRVMLGKNGRQMVEQRFDRIRSSNRLIQLVESIMK